MLQVEAAHKLTFPSAAATSPPATDVLASIASIPVDVVWLEDNIITAQISINTIRVTLGRSA